MLVYGATAAAAAAAAAADYYYYYYYYHCCCCSCCYYCYYCYDCGTGRLQLWRIRIPVVVIGSSGREPKRRLPRKSGGWAKPKKKLRKRRLSPIRPKCDQKTKR
jgi:hypothetical protein